MSQPNLPQFPAAGLTFLRKLRRNNRREWFLQHKETYEECVRQPMVNLVNALAPEFARFAPEFTASPKVSLYRIYRDTRFSKDKSPYKTNVAAGFFRRGLEKHEGAGFYLHITPSEFLIGGGLYSPLPEDLAAVRGYIELHHRRFNSILKVRGFQRIFGGLSGEQLVRVPRGFASNSPAADYLRRKQFLASRLLPSDVVTTTKFGSIVLETFRTLHPFLRFLNEPIVQARESTRRRNALLS